MDMSSTSSPNSPTSTHYYAINVEVEPKGGCFNYTCCPCPLPNNRQRVAMVALAALPLIIAGLMVQEVVTAKHHKKILPIAIAGLSSVATLLLCTWGGCCRARDPD